MSDIRATNSIGTPQFQTISSSVVVAADFDELTQTDEVDAYQIIVRNGNLRWLPNTDPTSTVGNIWRQNKQDTISREQFLTMRWIAESADVLMLVTPQEEVIGDSYFLKDAEVVKAQTLETFKISLDGKNLRYGVDGFGYVNNTDNADRLVIAASDTYQVVKPAVGNLEVQNSEEFSYNATTGEITYLGLGTDEVYKIVGNVTLKEVTGLVNGTCHFAIFKGSTPVCQSEVTLTGNNVAINLSLSSFFMLSTNDILTVRVKASGTGTVDAYHIQGFIEEVYLRD